MTGSAGNGNDGRGLGVDLSAAGRAGKPNTAAAFDGIDDYIEIADSASLHCGTGDFSIATWIRPEDNGNSDVIGDIVSKFDDASRKGLSLYVKVCSIARPRSPNYAH